MGIVAATTHLTRYRRGAEDEMIETNIRVRIDWEDLRNLSPEQCEAVMAGIAKVVSANPYEDEQTSTAQLEEEQ